MGMNSEPVYCYCSEILHRTIYSRNTNLDTVTLNQNLAVLILVGEQYFNDNVTEKGYLPGPVASQMNLFYLTFKCRICLIKTNFNAPVLLFT